MAWLQRRDAATDEAFWRQYLGDLETVCRLALPGCATDRFGSRSASAPTSVDQGDHEVVLGTDVLDGLRAVARHHRVTFASLLSAAWALAVSRAAATEDVVFGLTVSGRPAGLPGVESMVGLFINTVPLRVRVHADDSLDDVLSRVAATHASLVHYEHAPLSDIQRWCGVATSTALFDTLLVVENYPDRVVPDIGSQAGQSSYRPRISYPLTLLAGIGGTVSLRAVNHRDGVSDDAALQVLGVFRRVLERLADLGAGTADATVGDLLAVAKDERDLLLADVESTARPDLLGRHVGDVLRERLVADADRVAVADEHESLAAGALLARVHALTEVLEARGIGPGDRVGLFVGRSVDLVAAMLAVWERGGAFVPLDAQLPVERARMILADAAVAVVVVDDSAPADLAPTVPAIRLDAVGREGRARSGSPTRDPDSVAYVLFTSGSTGRPKGVAVGHSALANFLGSMAELPGLGPDDVLFSLTSPTFDTSLLELLLPLWVGALLVIGPDRAGRDGREFEAHLATLGITVVQATPSRWRVLMESGWEGATAKPILFSCGEAFPPDLVEPLVARGAQVWNLYGPTETTVYSSIAEITSSTTAVTVGRPIANTSMYVLDDCGNLVPFGAVGELCIGGAGVAVGYWQRPDVTASRFVPDPFRGGTMYRTGDLARRLTDGRVELLGRRDHQIKLRGHRIELGEVEAALAALDGVEAAAVLLRGGAEPGDEHLVAYVVGTAGSAADGEHLRDQLRDRLPSHMVPARCVFVDAMPLTPSAKVDRAALAARHPPGTVGRHRAEPADALEQVLLRLWRQRLDAPGLDVDSDFFDAGGDSLRAVRLAGAVARELGHELAVDAVFRYPSVRRLAEHLRTVTGDPGSRAAPPSSAGRRTLPETPLLRVEQRPLLALHAAGELEPVDGVALGYLDDELPGWLGLSRVDVVTRLCGELPFFSGLYETPWGRTGVITLPLFAGELYADADAVARSVRAAAAMAARIGARTMSLTSLLPSATDLGVTVAGCDGDGHVAAPVTLTTGHATTCAAVVLSVDAALRCSGRDLTDERLAVLGVGSIGASSVRLLLARRPHPRSVTLVDVPAARPRLEALAEELTEAGYRGPIECVDAGATAPQAVYDCSLVIGATNVPDILDVERLAAGSIVVDDSFPHCFDAAAAVARFERSTDVVVAEGGVVHAPEPMREVRYLPYGVEQLLTDELWHEYVQHQPSDIMGCVLSSVLTRSEYGLAATVGPVTADVAGQHLDALEQLGFIGPPPRCGAVLLDPRRLDTFRRRFGGERT